ncbi:hypothetical protein G6F57_017339 [Rhizopus arrhizus]|nr:hypothetical protein G6F57_017339 [Rhizopus arrhizus]
MIAHSDARIDADGSSAFVAAYQRVEPLQLGELWDIPIMMRLALIENLRRVAIRLAYANMNRGLADTWADAMRKAAQDDPTSLILVIANMARSNPPIDGAFVAELARRLQGHGPALALPLTWFEQRLAQYLGVKHLITVNSGSSANLVAFSTLTSPKLGERAIRRGDEVIGVAAGFPTTVKPILQFVAVPVFVDVELGTYNVNASLLEAAITPRTKAIMLAHTLGNPYNLDVVTALCKKYGLWLIEDCCDALGSTYNGRMVGTFGDIGTLSFYPAHHITMGEVVPRLGA